MLLYMLGMSILVLNRWTSPIRPTNFRVRTKIFSSIKNQRDKLEIGNSDGPNDGMS